MLFRRFRKDAYAAMRKRLIRETEAALHYGLTFPERSPRIPTVRVGCGTFRADYARDWWQSTLDIDLDRYEAGVRQLPHDSILPAFRRF